MAQYITRKLLEATEDLGAWDKREVIIVDYTLPFPWLVLKNYHAWTQKDQFVELLSYGQGGCKLKKLSIASEDAVKV